MLQAWTQLGTIDPKALAEARLQAHHAAQWLTRAARANLAPKPDDSHSSLGWDGARGAFASHAIGAADAGPIRFGLRIASLTLLVVQGGEVLDEFALDGTRDAEAGAWIDQHAAASGLRAPSSAILPYVIPPHPVAAGGRYSGASREPGFAELARWFAAASEILRETKTRLGAGASPVRCWPHHFDIATLLSLKAGDAESMPSIGIGMSPGDDYYAEPYFYVSPWPRPSESTLPDPPARGHWHTKDFVAAVVTGEALLACTDRHAGIGDFLAAAIAASRRLLGAR